MDLVSLILRKTIFPDQGLFFCKMLTRSSVQGQKLQISTNNTILIFFFFLQLYRLARQFKVFLRRYLVFAVKRLKS